MLRSVCTLSDSTPRRDYADLWPRVFPNRTIVFQGGDTFTEKSIKYDSFLARFPNITAIRKDDSGYEPCLTSGNVAAHPRHLECLDLTVPTSFVTSVKPAHVDKLVLRLSPTVSHRVSSNQLARTIQPITKHCPAPYSACRLPVFITKTERTRTQV